MQIPLSWLREFVEIDIPAEVLADKLTTAGLETSLEYLGVPQQQIDGIRVPPSNHLVWDRSKLVLGAIREVKPHPDAERLVLAMVDYGGDSLEQAVTGAPNLFEYKGLGPLAAPLWTGFALEGAEVWDGHSETPKRMILKGKPLRGIFNKTMVCSEKELGLSEEHEGVILLHNQPKAADGTPYAPGTPLQDVFGDVLLHVELTPNLARCYSVLGVAREVAALLNKPLRQADLTVVQDGAPIGGQISVVIDNAEMNPRFTAMLIKGTKVQPSPEWLQRRLRLAGQRPINNIVDVTNYVMFEVGQPLHAFDYDKLVARAAGKTPTLTTRLAKPGETLLTLDGQTRALTPDIELIEDTVGIVSLAGVMGGAETEIDTTTTSVLLEAAAWNFINIRRTSQSQKLFSEAATRFSRGVHPAQAEVGVRRGIELMRQTGGGTVAQGVLDVIALPAPVITVDLKIGEIPRLTGMTVSVEKAADVLTRLGFDVTARADGLRAVVPDHRMDISDDPIIGQADLVEEIARVIGLDHLPMTLMNETLPAQWSNTALEREELARDVLAGLGLRENITHRFVTPEQEALFIPRGASGSPGVNRPTDASYVTIANPVQPDKTAMRQSILSNMLTVARNNLRHAPRIATFEVGAVYFRREGQELPDEPRRLGIVLAGQRSHQHWEPAAPGTFDFYDLKGVVEGLLKGLHIRGAQIVTGGATWLHPGRSATLQVGGSPIGSFGELHPLSAQALDLPDDIRFYVGEFDADALLMAVDPLHKVGDIYTSPPVYEDLALVVAESVPAGDVLTALQGAGGQFLRSVTLFDVYRGGSVAAGQKSLAFSLVYQAEDHTLTEAEIAATRKKLIKAAQKQFEATLRA